MGGLTRRQTLAAAAVAAAGGAGLTASQGLRSASVSGQVDVEAEQALTVETVDVEGTGDADASFTRVTDDNTGLQVSVEANNGDEFTVEADIKNASADSLAVRTRITTPDAISVASVETGNGEGVIQSDTAEYVIDLSPGSTTLDFSFKISDTAAPGARNIDMDMTPLSTDDG